VNFKQNFCHIFKHRGFFAVGKIFAEKYIRKQSYSGNKIKKLEAHKRKHAPDAKRHKIKTYK
jgi:hypothetical protein